MIRIKSQTEAATPTVSATKDRKGPPTASRRRGPGLVFMVLALLLMALPGWAADNIDGRVVDDHGAPIPGVSVVTNVSGLGTLTDDDGYFELPVSDDISRVTFSAVGFRAHQFKIDRVPQEIVLEATYIRGEDIVVTADRARVGETPVAFDNFSRDEINRDYTVTEFPLLLAGTPNLYSFSDAGSSLGYSYLRIRGFDDKRVSVYINGVPLNDPEDQATYFVDLPDFAANVTDIQVQRGVGNSLYGDASFGGSVNIVTSGLIRPRRVAFTSGYGEYLSGDSSLAGIYKQSLEYSSGLIDGRWTLSGRFSKQKTGGYRYNSWYEGWSYYYSLARLDPNMWTELYVYGGPMKMHLAYSGATREDTRTDRRVNPYHTYSNETDNFNQPHYHLHNIYRISERTTLTNTLYYIRGKGYYEQLKEDRTYADYNLDTSQTGGNASGHLVRQQHVTKNHYGWNPRLDMVHDRGRHTLGGSFYYFESDHWGKVVWAQHLTGDFDPQHRYYQYYGDKWLASLYLQESYDLADSWSILATAQGRYQHYSFDQEKMGAYKGYDYDVDWFFFSPRLGVNYTPDSAVSLYASFAVSSRNPTDYAVYDASDPHVLPSLEIESRTINGADTTYTFGDPTAASERVYNFELGGQYRQPRWVAGVNLFFMDFRDEIVPYGGISPDFGILRTINVDRSVHAGVELTGAVEPLPNLRFDANFSYNYNRIKEYVGQIEVYPDAGDSYRYDIDYADKKIAGFPDYLGNLVVDYHTDVWRATLRARLVGEQYMDLLNTDSLAIDPYTMASLSLSYRFADVLSVGDLTLSAHVDNLFDRKYETSGYAWAYGLSTAEGAPVTIVREAEYYVAAERSFYGQIMLEVF